MTYEEIQQQALLTWRRFQETDKVRILVGSGTCGRAAGGIEVMEALQRRLAERGAEAELVEVGCLGLCYAEPMMEIIKPGKPGMLYSSLTPEIAQQLLDDYVLGDDPHVDLAMATMGDQSVNGIPRFADLPMLKGQIRVALRNCGHIDPGNIDHYIANGGYQSLSKVLKMTQEQVIEEVKRSGLRGRGGAGFPTGLKWEFCHKAKGDPKYVVCNADEGDPGAFMDRGVLESDPHSMLEGMTIAAYAIGASQGYIYVRAEYPLAIERLTVALQQMEQYGLIGDHILESGFGFHIKIKEGAGAFVCGEETALMASIEGRRGMPRPRPPFPAQKGLFGKPTNINNVETLANIPMILERGGEWYSQFGTENSRGTKTFALAGKVAHTGLIEVPMGITLRQIVFEIGGGILKGKEFKAAQMGGPSGGCIPASCLDLPIDYESVKKVGAIMGSGGLIVMDESTCMVDIARFFIDFCQNESCGKCVPCRVGTKRMLEILERITRGEGKLEDMDRLAELGDMVKEASLCALGQTAPNPVLSTIRYFRDEYEAHIIEKHCPAASCEALMTAPCSHTCPAGINVPEYVALIGEGKFREAVEVIRERNPFPSVCGRVCDHPCEQRCRRGEMDDPIAIRILKRFACDRTRSIELPPIPWKRHGRVAVVGAGPGGLTAAYFLALMGREVVVFEALPVAGGMLAMGIPEYRLPKEVLQEEIETIQSAGVEIRLSTPIDSLEALTNDGFDATVIAVGAHTGTKLRIESEDAEGVFDGVTFLREVAQGHRKSLSGRVSVIGGGNVAIDSARTALRLGADEVTILYRRSREEMPAWEEEIEDAEKEGIAIRYLTTPIAVIQGNGTVAGLRCMRMILGDADEGGRRRPVPVEGSEFDVETDVVIAAIGQRPDLGLVRDSDMLQTPWGGLEVDRVTMQTSKEGVFAVGDCVTGPATAIEAIGAGQRAAVAVDRYLGGKGKLPPHTHYARAEQPEPLPEGVEPPPRLKARKLSPAKRRKGFEEVEKCPSKNLAIQETGRCLRCDLELES